MKNIYSPADIERLLESILGRPADIARLPEQERALATERRNVFVDAVGAAVAAEVLTLRSGSIRPVVPSPRQPPCTTQDVRRASTSSMWRTHVAPTW